MQLAGRIASILIIGVLVTPLIMTPSTAAPSLSRLTQDWNRTSRKINDVRRDLRVTKQRQQDATQRLVVAKHRLEVTRLGLKDIQNQLSDTRNKLASTQAELVKVERRLKERNDLLSSRLVDTYKHGSVSYLSVLLGAADFWDLLSRSYAVKKVLNSDVELIDAINKDKQTIEEHKATLEAQEQKRVELEEKQLVLTNAAQSQTQECQQLLKDIEKDRAKLERDLAALEADSRSIASMIRQMQQTPEGKKRLSQVWTGSFIQPVSGRITSGFGMRMHPILKRRSMHTGVDIAAPYGTTIKAAAGGYVTFAGWRSAYGNTVVIDHGGGVISFYAHCSSFLVRAGTTVKQGQAIARVGSTGLSTGNHLHFEVQKNGKPVPPF